MDFEFDYTFDRHTPLELALRAVREPYLDHLEVVLEARAVRLLGPESHGLSGVGELLCVDYDDDTSTWVNLAAHARDALGSLEARLHEARQAYPHAPRVYVSGEHMGPMDEHTELEGQPQADDVFGRLIERMDEHAELEVGVRQRHEYTNPVEFTRELVDRCSEHTTGLHASAQPTDDGPDWGDVLLDIAARALREYHMVLCSRGADLPLPTQSR